MKPARSFARASKDMSRPPVVFIIGRTSSGKTPIAQKGFASAGFHHISASQYFSGAFPDQKLALARRHVSADHPTMLKFQEEMADFCKSELAKDPDCNLRHLEKSIRAAGKSCVIEGIRNPYEFLNLYNPATDFVIFLDHAGGVIQPTIFDARGVPLIRETLLWMLDAGVAPKDSVVEFSYGENWLNGRYLAANTPFLNKTFLKNDTRQAIDALIDLAPKMALRRLKPGGTEKCPSPA